jgi:regulator of replication initiation timing
MTTARLVNGPALDLRRAAGSTSDAALLERLRTLRSIVPAMATEIAIARREGARLRTENARLRSRLAEVEEADASGAAAPALASTGMGLR